MSKQQLKKYGTTFHFASHFLSTAQIQSAAELYGICREIDDLADTASDTSQARTQLLLLRQALIDEITRTPSWPKHSRFGHRLALML